MKTAILTITIVSTLCAAASSIAADAIPAKPQLAKENQDAWDFLPKMLSITYEAGPEVPTSGRCLQDSDGGIIHDTLISVGGFGIPEKYPESVKRFIKKVYGINLNEPQKGWRELPDFPGIRRQEHASIDVDDKLYVWGGFSYLEPYAFEDGYCLSREGDEWTWERLPDLPWKSASAGICAIGSKVYLMGGTDYDFKTMYTNTDRNGNTQRLGARMLCIDTKDLASGWKELAQCPGTARWVHAMAAVDGKVYVIGGATGTDNAAEAYCTVVDNWLYDPATDSWTRLADSPVASGNFSPGRIVYDNRYILLICGAQYDHILNPDGTTRAVYGKPYRHYKTKPYFSDVFVYDTKTGLFGMGDPLPLNNCLPPTYVRGNKVHMLGDETDGACVEGVFYEHRPNLYLIGTIKAVAEKDWQEQLKHME
jgi:Kelch motif protein/kelch motif-containing protein